DFSERKDRADSAGAIAFKAIEKLLMGVHDAQVFTLVPPAISSLGNATGFDFRLQDRANAGSAALAQATGQLMGMAMQSPVLSQVRITGLGEGPQLNLTVDRGKAAARGVAFGAVAARLSTAPGPAFMGRSPNLGPSQHL